MDKNYLMAFTGTGHSAKIPMNYIHGSKDRIFKTVTDSKKWNAINFHSGDLFYVNGIDGIAGNFD
jgi:hypothetical protein